MSETQSVTNIIGKSYNPDYEAFDVTISDQHSEVITALVCRSLGSVTIASNTAIDQRVIPFVAGHGIQVGEMLCFKESARYMQATVLTVDTNDITIDTPLDFAFTTEATVNRMTPNMAVDGSSTPVEYMITPPVGATWDITQLTFTITDQSAMDSGLFGGITALTNGCFLRVENGITKNIGNVKKNGDFSAMGLAVQYDDKAPSGYYTLTATASIKNDLGVVLRISNGEYIVIGIQDNLTDLDLMVATVGGHKVVD